MHFKPASWRGPFLAMSDILAGLRANFYCCVIFVPMERNERSEDEMMEVVERLKQGFEERGIKAVLFDVDDTLVRTRSLFDEAVSNYGRDLAGLADGNIDQVLCTDGVFDVERFYRSWREAWWMLKPEFEVNPASHVWSAMIMAKRMGLDPDSKSVQAAIERLCAGVYETVPEDVEGAREAVELIFSTGVGVGYVTHAGDEWTRLKMRNWAGRFGMGVCTDVTKPKDWAGALGELGYLPEEVIGIGDSWGSDVIPLYEAGVGEIYWLNLGGEERELPEGVVEVRSMEEMVAKMI